MIKAIDRPHPSLPQLILGFVLAPLVPAILYGLTVSIFTGMNGGDLVEFVTLGLLFAGTLPPSSSAFRRTWFSVVASRQGRPTSR